MLNNIVDPSKPQMTIWRMPIAYRLPEATNAHLEYVTHCFSTATVRSRTKAPE